MTPRPCCTTADTSAAARPVSTSAGPTPPVPPSPWQLDAVRGEDRLAARPRLRPLPAQRAPTARRPVPARARTSRRRPRRRRPAVATRGSSEPEPHGREVPEARRQPERDEHRRERQTRRSAAPTPAVSGLARSAPSRRRRRTGTCPGASGSRRARPGSGSRGSSRSGRRPEACTGRRPVPTSGASSRPPGRAPAGSSASRRCEPPSSPAGARGSRPPSRTRPWRRSSRRKPR